MKIEDVVLDLKNDYTEAKAGYALVMLNQMIDSDKKYGLLQAELMHKMLRTILSKKAGSFQLQTALEYWMTMFDHSTTWISNQPYETRQEVTHG